MLRVQNNIGNGTAASLPNTPPDLALGHGALTWLRSGSVALSATLFNPASNGTTPVSGGLTVSNSSVPAPSLQSIMIGPRNAIINSGPSVTNVSLQAFYSDGTSQAVTNATFSTNQPAAKVVLAGNQLQDLDVRGQPAGHPQHHRHLGQPHRYGQLADQHSLRRSFSGSGQPPSA